MVLARAAERRVSHFDSQGLTSTAGVFATAAQWEAALFVALVRAAQPRWGEFSP